MEWDINIHNEDGYVEITTSGIVDKDTSLEMAHAIAHAMRTNRLTKALIDHRNIESVVGDTMDIYDRPTVFRLIGVILRIRIAEVINPEHQVHFRFFETVCHNRGYQLNVFHTKDEALAWLIS